MHDESRQMARAMILDLIREHPSIKIWDIYDDVSRVYGKMATRRAWRDAVDAGEIEILTRGFCALRTREDEST
jgi:hypothetical protein